MTVDYTVLAGPCHLAGPTGIDYAEDAEDAEES